MYYLFILSWAVNILITANLLYFLYEVSYICNIALPLLDSATYYYNQLKIEKSV